MAGQYRIQAGVAAGDETLAPAASLTPSSNAVQELLSAEHAEDAEPWIVPSSALGALRALRGEKLMDSDNQSLSVNGELCFHPRGRRVHPQVSCPDARERDSHRRELGIRERRLDGHAAGPACPRLLPRLAIV